MTVYLENTRTSKSNQTVKRKTHLSESPLDGGMNSTIHLLGEVLLFTVERCLKVFEGGY